MSWDNAVVWGKYDCREVEYVLIVRRVGDEPRTSASIAGFGARVNFFPRGQDL